MSQKWHISSNGEPGVCKATKRPCPLGGEETHFNSEEEAASYIHNQEVKEHGLLPGVESNIAEEHSIIENDYFPDFSDLNVNDKLNYEDNLNETIQEEVWTEFMEVLRKGSRGLNTFKKDKVLEGINRRALESMNKSYGIHGEKLFEDKKIFERELIRAQSENAVKAMHRGDIVRHGN